MSIFAKTKVALPNSRVVYRGNNNANANGGVAYANATNDASNTNANIGSRLANKINYRIIGVQKQGCIPNSVPRGASLSNSVRNYGKLKN